MDLYFWVCEQAIDNLRLCTMMSGTSGTLPSLANIEFSHLNLTQNCSSTAQFLQAFYEIGDVGWLATSRFLLDSLPPSVWLNMTRLDVDSALFSWFQSANVSRNVLDSAAAACRTQLCPLLHWDGEPDAAGIGVSIPRKSTV